MATLTYIYAESTAVVGPLATQAEPHGYDLCEEHADRLTVPRGWDAVRHEGDYQTQLPYADDLAALADAVREAGGSVAVPAGPPEAPGRRGHLRAVPDRR